MAAATLYKDEVKRAKLKPEPQWEIEQGLSLSARAAYEANLIRSQWYATYAGLFERLAAVVLPSA